MIKAVVTKKPSESFSIGFDFTDLLATGAIVSTCTVSAIDQKFGRDYSSGAEKVITSTNATIDTDDKTALMKILAGVAGYRYVITFVATTSSSDTLIGRILMIVEA